MAKKAQLEKEELQEFVIEETTPEQIEVTVAGTIEELEKFDFSSEEKFDIDHHFEFVEALMNGEEEQSIAEIMEAENIIKKTASELLMENLADNIDKERMNLKAFLAKYSTEVEETQQLPEEDIDKLDRIAKYLFDGYQKNLNNLVYKFDLTRDEYKFVYTTPHKLEYDQNEIFQMEELIKTYFDKHRDFDKKVPKDQDEIPTFISVNSLILLYHFVSKNKVKGLTREFYTYKSLLSKIAERMKLFNAYNTVMTRLSSDFIGWTTALNGMLEQRAAEVEDKKE